jgi:hypothetical protein
MLITFDLWWHLLRESKVLIGLVKGALRSSGMKLRYDRNSQHIIGQPDLGLRLQARHVIMSRFSEPALPALGSCL